MLLSLSSLCFSPLSICPFVLSSLPFSELSSNEPNGKKNAETSQLGSLVAAPPCIVMPMRSFHAGGRASGGLISREGLSFPLVALKVNSTLALPPFFWLGGQDA